MEPNKWTVGLAGVVLGILANSPKEISSQPFRFHNPVPITATEEQIGRVLRKSPIMKDKEYFLDILGIEVPIVTYRTVTDSAGNSYTGKLDSKGNIHTDYGVAELQHAHDSRWYTWKLNKTE